ncbi:probable vacuolar amino acid transporter YPQ1 [Asparagus officinalis]|uniref:probable vacuolar amino acid transporter YPQ1 n=1 Tax=Asparagus officinalis TaxID=4686 RepID=UPI00098DEE5F|nr:probable vacuolar amino acid transporter YPQ1 [Asparagus officinalis]
MLLSKGRTPFCSPNRHCSQWAWTYLKYCLCTAKDGVALSLGLVSVFSWGVAEVPQIITNFKEKSTEGLSIAFLMTWIVGDLFNLMGCWLEPETLPTQFYMAVLYTFTTVVLTGQTVYYGHIYPQMKANRISLLHKSQKLEDALAKEKLLYKIDEKEDKTNDDQANGSDHVNEVCHVASSPISVSSLYYTSARSLSKSPVPITGTWSAHTRDSGRTPSILTHDQNSPREPLLGRLGPAQSAPALTTKNMLCVVSSSVFLLCTYHFHISTSHTFDKSPPGMIIMVGRKLLQSQADGSSVGHGGVGSEIGTILGWAMAAIYMGGRLPQICLNIRRGNVEGLSPLMFIFALIGNATYVGSILVNSVDWSKIRPNMPWLVDAGGCVLLDSFILVQFVYFSYWRSENAGNRCDS